MMRAATKTRAEKDKGTLPQNTQRGSVGAPRWVQRTLEQPRKPAGASTTNWPHKPSFFSPARERPDELEDDQIRHNPPVQPEGAGVGRVRRGEDVEAVAAGVEEPLHADEVADLAEGAAADDSRDEVLRELG